MLFALGSSGASQSGKLATWVDWLKIVLGVLLLAVARNRQEVMRGEAPGSSHT